MIRIVQLTILLALLISCSTERQHEIPTIISTPNSLGSIRNSLDNFHEGFWVNEKSLKVLMDGDLNYNSEWNSIKTFQKRGKPMLLINDPLGADTFELHRADSHYQVSLLEVPFCGIDSIKFITKDSLICIHDYNAKKYVSIDSARVIYKYFFAGKYRVHYLNTDAQISLEANGNVIGWKGVTNYSSNSDSEKPTFSLINKDSVIHVYYIQDNPLGFDLFEIIDCENHNWQKETINIGTLSYQFKKS